MTQSETPLLSDGGTVHEQSLTFFEDEHAVAFVSPRPSTPGEVILKSKARILCIIGYVTREDYVRTLQSAKQVAALVKAVTGVRRVALVDNDQNEIRLVPLHGIDASWKPMLDPHLEFYTEYPGYISSKSGPKQSDEMLEKAQVDLTTIRDPAMTRTLPAMDLTCYTEGEKAKNLFAKIIRGELEQWRIWESKSHVAFLTPFGNTYGKTVLVPRKHLDSDILSLPESDFEDLAGAVWDVAKVTRRSALDESVQVGLIFEGMEVDWAHAKLIPIILDIGKTSEQPFTEKYTGSVSSQPGPPASSEELQKTLAMYQSATGMKE